MTRLCETLPTARLLEVAVRTTGPAGMARAFAAQAGVIYDREAFDALARRVRDLYAARSGEAARTFRSRLDRRLYDRYHDPVAWEVAPPPARRPAA
jgi:hypothetical protein